MKILTEILSFLLLSILYIVPIVCYTVYQVSKLKYSQTVINTKNATINYGKGEKSE